MGNGALPNGPSYRAHPRLYQFGRQRQTAEKPRFGLVFAECLVAQLQSQPFFPKAEIAP